MPARWRRCSTELKRSPVPCSFRSARTALYASLLDLQECQERNVRLVAPVQENDFTEQKRAQAGPPRIGKDQFQWLPEEQTYRCPEGHRLNYKGKEQKRRRDDNTVTQHRFHCPAEHCRACPRRERCVRDPEKGRTVKRLEGEELIESAQGVDENGGGQGSESPSRIGDRTLFWRCEATSRSPALARSWTEKGQGRDRPGDLGPNRPHPGAAERERRKPSGKCGLKAGRSPRRGGQGGWLRHDRSQDLSMLFLSQSFRIPRARREESFSLSKAPASPPLPPLRKRGKGIARSRRHSIARHKTMRLETVSPARSTPTFHHPRSSAPWHLGPLP